MNLGIMKGILLIFSTLIALSLCQTENQEKDIFIFPDSIHIGLSPPLSHIVPTVAPRPPQRPSQHPTQPPPQQSNDSAITSFSWRLFQGSKLANPAGNFVLSPVILQFLLAVLEKAADGETKRQLGESIGIEDVRILSKLFRPTANSVQLEAATGIFVDASQTLNPSYVNFTRSVGADIYSSDFMYNPDAAKDSINFWASEVTHGTINNLIGAGYDIRGSQIVLATAIFFHSNWKQSFNRSNPQMFFSGPGKTNGNIVEFMETKQNFVVDSVGLGQNNIATVLEIPYENQDYSMLLIVPNEDVDLGYFIKQMDVTDFDNIIKKTSTSFPKFMTLRMPKFKIKSRFSVVNALLKMGVVDLFTIQSRLPHMGLRDEPKVSDVLQQAMLIVDEQGTIASAANIAILLPLSFGPREDPVFTVNRPFVSVIVDKKNKIPLFISKIYNPTLG